MVRFLGIINVFLLILLLSPFFLRRINKYLYQNKNKTFKKHIAFLSKMHMYIAYILLVTAFVHGYMALGAIALHSGLILWLLVFVQVILGNMFKKMKKPYLLKLHRIAGLSSLLLLLIHLLQVK